MDVKKVRDFAREILRECERREYTIEETELLSIILKDELRQCGEDAKVARFRTGWGDYSAAGGAVDAIAPPPSYRIQTPPPKRK